MPLTLITRETFQGVGTLDSVTRGNLGTVNAGSFYKRAVGPRLTGDTTANSLGWSADLRLVGNAANVRHTLVTTATGAADLGFFSAFFYFNSFANNGANKFWLIEATCANTNQLIRLICNSTTGNFEYNRNPGFTDTDTGVAVPLMQWFEVRLCWEKTSGTSYKQYLQYRLAGTSAWVVIYASATTGNANSLLASVRATANSGASFGFFIGRYGMPSLYQMAAVSERDLLVSDVVDPTGPTTWYVDPVSGNDSNDGVTSGSAWLTVAKVNLESLHGGFFAKANYATGDTLRIDTTVQNWLLGTASLRIFTSGLNVIQLGGGRAGTGELQAWKQITAGEWSGPIASTTKVYQATLSEVNTNIVLWENDLWMNHPKGANLAAVRATLESTPGSFWTDGTTMYCHPFGDTNPASDGKTYTRSYNRGSGQSAVEMLAPNFNVIGLRVRKTCLALPNAVGAILGYCFQSNSGAGGTSRMENCYGDYGDKHVFGFTDNAADRRYHIINCQAEQGSPYAGTGGQTPWVDYSSFAVLQDNQTLYEGCVTLQPTGLIGSTAGAVGHDAYICHNNGTANTNFSLISFVDCQINGGLDAGGAILNCIVDNSTVTGIVYRGKGACDVDRSKATRSGFFNNSTGSLTVTNSLIVPDRGPSTNAEYLVSGAIAYLGCTFDLRNVTAQNTTGLFRRGGSISFLFRDCLWMTGANNYTVLENATSADTLTFNNNAYQLGAASKVVTNYNDGTTTADRTFTQWTALGKDANSITTTDAKINASYYPLGGSPLTGVGTDRGQSLDYSGKTVRRISIGALEMLGGDLFMDGLRPGKTSRLPARLPMVPTSMR